MKKKYLFVALSSVLFTSFIGTNVVEAQVVGTMNSITDVTFTEDTSVTSPVNPLDPTKPVQPVNPADPNDPHSTGTAGPLSIDYVSNFHFGNQTVQNTNATYYAKLDNVKDTSSGNTIQVPNFVQVTDKRGAHNGWHLTVKQNGQFKTTDVSQTPLDNAVLTLGSGTAISVTNALYAPIITPVILDPTGTISSTVATAAPLTGMGTWDVAFGKNNTEGANAISLAVPFTTNKKTGVQYKTSLTWNLEDAPL